MTDVPAPARTPRGTFAPGQSGNPGGRVGLPADVRQALEDAVPLAVTRLTELLNDEDGRLRLAAAEALMSRLYGRPAQAIDANITKVESVATLHLQALQEIAARREARLRAAETIKG